MAVANRKVTEKVRKQRWLKYFAYIFITGAVVVSIMYDFFYWMALVITAVSFIELLKVNFLKAIVSLRHVIVSLVFFLVVASGFLLFAATFINSFVLFIYFQVLVFDGFCQITGQLFGKKQLAPKISPSKTREGLAGGWLSCIVAAMLAASWVSLSLVEAILFGLLTGLASFIGDMLASVYKRKAGVKDYSNWLPGQGGFLDRFDSFFFTASVYSLLYIANFTATFELFIRT